MSSFSLCGSKMLIFDGSKSVKLQLDPTDYYGANTAYSSQPITTSKTHYYWRLFVKGKACLIGIGLDSATKATNNWYGNQKHVNYLYYSGGIIYSNGNDTETTYKWSSNLGHDHEGEFCMYLDKINETQWSLSFSIVNLMDKKQSHIINLNECQPLYFAVGFEYGGGCTKEVKIEEFIATNDQIEIENKTDDHDEPVSMQLYVDLQQKFIELQKVHTETIDKLKQIENIKIEETKDNGVVSLKKQIETLQQTVNLLMTQLSSKQTNETESAMEKWLNNMVELPQYIGLFNDNGLEDLNTVKLLTEKDLVSIGIEKFGHKLRIIKEIEKLNNNNQPSKYEGGTAFI
eukprot:383967_1